VNPAEHVYRIITFNIAHGRGLSFYQGFQSADRIERNLNKITDVLTGARADVVAMQEVDQESWWNKNIDLLEVIRRNTPYHHSYLGINNLRPGARNLNYGNAILSRHPIESRYNQPFELRQIGGKGFMFANIQIGEQCVPVINMHLDFRSRFRRLAQIDVVIDFLKTREPYAEETLMPVICGDFNCPRRRTGDAVHRLFDYLSDHGYQLFPEKARTFPAHFPTRTIDFIFMPPGCDVLHVQALPVYVSDHRPVLVEFCIAGEVTDLNRGIADAVG
jgi:endonuclease/exonuclease/phosphatase family metal-dependent hydrolase